MDYTESNQRQNDTGVTNWQESMASKLTGKDFHVQIGFKSVYVYFLVSSKVEYFQTWCTANGTGILPAPQLAAA